MQVELNGQMVLSVPMVQPNDADARTIREYLVALARAVWVEGEGFSGKRPFGNSDWRREVYDSLEAFGLPATEAVMELAFGELKGDRDGRDQDI